MKKFPGDFRRHPRPGVFEFGNDFIFTQAKPHDDFAPFRHGVGGIVNDVIEHPAETFRIERNFDRRNRPFNFKARIAQLHFGPDFVQNCCYEIGVVQIGENDFRARALREIQDVPDHFADPVHLLANRGGGFLARFKGRVFQGGHFRRQSDNVQGIFQIVNDRAGEASDHRQLLGLQDLKNQIGRAHV